MLCSLTKCELTQHAKFESDDWNFMLKASPGGVKVAYNSYFMPTQGIVGHPLAQHAISAA